MSKCRRTVFLCCGVSALSLTGAMIAAPALAQTESEGRASAVNDELVVTAQRREERLQDVPASVAAFGEGALADQRIDRPQDLVNVVPGLTISNPYGEGNPPVFILRGVAANDFSLTQTRPIAIYVDDALRAGFTFEAVPFFDLERVEVLKGPQGALYGKNATGGAIRIISKAPDFEPEGYITVGLGNYDQREVEAAGQIPVVDDVLAMRAAVKYVKNEGYVEDLVPGKPNEDQTDVFAGRISFLFKPTDAFDATIRLGHNRARGGAGSILPLQVNTALIGVDRSGLDFFEQETDRASSLLIDSYTLNATLNYQLSDNYTVTSVTAIDWGRYRGKTDEDGLPVGVVSGDYFVRDARAIYQGINVTSSYDGPFNWLAGFNYSTDRMNTGVVYRVFADPALGIPDPFGFGTAGFGISYGNDFQQKRTGFAGFLRADLEILPNVNVFAGARYSDDTVEVIDFFSAISSNPPTIPDPDTPLFTDIDRKGEFDNWSTEAGIEWDVADNVLAYATFKQGYRPGAVNAQGFFSPLEVNVVAPEKADSFEVGLKTQAYEQRLTFNAAGFYVDYEDQQILNSDPVTALSSLFNVSGRIYGFEADAQFRPIDILNLYAQVSVLDSEYKSGSSVGVAFDADLLPIADSGTPVGGNQMIGAAHTAANIGGEAILAQTSFGDLKIGGNAGYTSRVYYNAFQDPDVSTPGQWLFNGRLAVEADNVTVALWAKNISNKEYIAYANDYRSSVGYILTHRGAPRTYGIEVGYRF